MEKLSKIGMLACAIVLVTIVTIIVYYIIYKKDGIPVENEEGERIYYSYYLAAFPNTNSGV